ncbi:hypothetical protein TrRE_jg8487 [Triparma retinervis]|uniref:Uncharacterized protein n=1 Tax=Triparma retinervis TaxID=2557542 RepID=A0A9W6ZFL3_9STRA|nr:hypothetical protein TrRE_jg8487 [Triparma retinervis]
MEEGVFLQTRRMDDLASCATVKDAFVKNGLQPDDKIDRREQVLMFRTVEKEMETGLKTLMEMGKFDEAKEMGFRLEGLRAEFGGLQTKDEMVRQNRQKTLFDKAKKIKSRQLSVRHKDWKSQVESHCKEFLEESEKEFEIQRENLALEMGRIEKPRIKYSKARMEYKNAEVKLSNLKQYDDAKNVRRMLKTIDAREEAAWDKAFEDKMQAKINKLAEFQKDSRARHVEKMSAITWKELRKREKEQYISETGVNNKNRDMEHAMYIDSKMKPELTVHPSALLKKRANYNKNASKLRGEQLLDKVKGKKEGDAVFIESLCDLHKFSDKTLSGTTRYEGKIKWSEYKSGQEYFD